MEAIVGYAVGMQKFPEYVMQLRNDVRLLRLDKDRLTRAHQSQKDKVQRLERQLKEQAQRIKELERENEQLKREREASDKTKKRYQVALFDHGNFQHPTTKTKKKKGGQPGHADTNRERHQPSSPTQTRRLFAAQCGTCGHDLARVNATRQKALIDIVLHPHVSRVSIESERQWCGDCKQEICARDPHSLPFTEYGLNTFLLVMILRFQSHASLSSISRVLEISHGLRISPSTISNLLGQAKGYLRETYEQLLKQVRAGNVMYADETGWLVNGQTAWMWLIANDEVTVYFAAESRGGGIARELYGQSQAMCMHDGYAAYTKTIAPQNHLYCWAHLLRFAHEETILESADTPAAHLRQDLVRIYHLGRELAAAGSPNAQARLRAELDAVLAVQSDQPGVHNIQGRLRVQAEGLIRALLCTPDATNNLAERELRPMVLMRKNSNGSNTFTGMETSAIIGSVVQTFAKRDAPALSSLQRAVQQGVQDQSSQYRHATSVDSS
jgi:transposase